MGDLGEVIEITSTTTYAGSGKLFWVNIHATANTTVVISDDSTEKLSLYQAQSTSSLYTFMPSIRVKTSLVLTVSGTAKITTCHNVS